MLHHGSTRYLFCQRGMHIIKLQEGRMHRRRVCIAVMSSPSSVYKVRHVVKSTVIMMNRRNAVSKHVVQAVCSGAVECYSRSIVPQPSNKGHHYYATTRSVFW